MAASSSNTESRKDGRLKRFNGTGWQMFSIGELLDTQSKNPEGRMGSTGTAGILDRRLDHTSVKTKVVKRVDQPHQPQHMSDVVACSRGRRRPTAAETLIRATLSALRSIQKFLDVTSTPERPVIGTSTPERPAIGQSNERPTIGQSNATMRTPLGSFSFDEDERSTRKREPWRLGQIEKNGANGSVAEASATGTTGMPARGLGGENAAGSSEAPEAGRADNRPDGYNRESALLPLSNVWWSAESALLPVSEDRLRSVEMSTKLGLCCQHRVWRCPHCSVEMSTEWHRVWKFVYPLLDELSFEMQQAEMRAQAELAAMVENAANCPTLVACDFGWLDM
jgi:hypothetical protein